MHRSAARLDNVLLLCSDGVHGVLPSFLPVVGGLTDWAEATLAEVADRGGTDDATLVVARRRQEPWSNRQS